MLSPTYNWMGSSNAAAARPIDIVFLANARARRRSR